MRRVVLVTRPEPGLGETMRAVAALGFEPLAVPLLRIEPLAPSIPHRAQAVLLTSGQAVAPLAALAPWLLGVPVLAVGDTTAARAQAAGFSTVASAGRDASALASLSTRTLLPGGDALLLACGQGQGGRLAGLLREAGFRVTKRCLYRASQARFLGDDAVCALREGRVHAVLFFSGETAAAFIRAVPQDLALDDVRALAISANAAATLSAFSWRSIERCAAPTARALLDLLTR